jgi:hypothetical protein
MPGFLLLITMFFLLREKAFGGCQIIAIKIALLQITKKRPEES